jgi:UDP-glucuronate decarboxylase
VVSNFNLTYKALPQDDPVRRRPDITLARKKLDWEPKVKLEEGLVKTVAYFEDILRRYSVSRFVDLSATQ